MGVALRFLIIFAAVVIVGLVLASWWWRRPDYMRWARRVFVFTIVLAFVFFAGLIVERMQAEPGQVPGAPTPAPTRSEGPPARLAGPLSRLPSV